MNSQTQKAFGTKKGLSYGEIILDNILGLDNEYESFGEQLGKAINKDEIRFLKDAAVGIYEGAKEFIANPIETTKEVVVNIKDSVQRLGTENLDARIKRMYNVSYDQATDQQVSSAREAVFGDALTALELIPAAKAGTVTARAAVSAIPSGVKADVVGQTKALLTGDTEFLKGTPTERSTTVGVGAQRVDNPTIQFETSSGSTYDQFENATTIRNRAERDDNEVSGVQPRSGKTVFMDKESIDTIGPLFQNTEIPVQFIPLEGNKAKLIYTEDYGPKKAGEDASNVVQFTTSPRMGLHPVEIMDSKNTDRRNIHFGNEIVKIKPLSNLPVVTETIKNIVDKDSSEYVYVIHGGATFEGLPDLDSKKSTGEAVRSRFALYPLGKGMYGVVVDATNVQKAISSIGLAQHYAKKYGGTSTAPGQLHLFKVKRKDFNSAVLKGEALDKARQRGLEGVDRYYDRKGENVRSVSYENLQGTLHKLQEVSIKDPSLLIKVNTFNLDTTPEEILKFAPLDIPLTKPKKETNPLVREIDYSGTRVGDTADFKSSVLGSLDNLAIGKDGMSGFQIKKFFEKRAPKINKTELYWSGLLENLDDNKKYTLKELRKIVDVNVPQISVIVKDTPTEFEYEDLQRLALSIEGKGFQSQNYKEILIKNNNPKGNFYESAVTHWGDGAIIAHIRGSIVESFSRSKEPPQVGKGKIVNREKVFLVEELQSDAVQKHVVAGKNSAKEVKKVKDSLMAFDEMKGYFNDEILEFVTAYHFNAGGRVEDNLNFTNKFIKDIESHNYDFNSIADLDTAEQAIELGLGKTVEKVSDLKYRFERAEINKQELLEEIKSEFNLKPSSVSRRNIEDLNEIDNILANTLSDYVFGKSSVRKYNKESSNSVKQDLIDLFGSIKDQRSERLSNLSPASLSDTIKISLLTVIREAKAEGINKIYIPSPEVMAYTHNLSRKASKNTYGDGVEKVLRTLNSETGGKIKFKNKNPESINYYADVNSVGIEIDITDFELPDNPQFRFNMGGLAVGPMSELERQRETNIAEQMATLPKSVSLDKPKELKLPQKVKQEVEEYLRPKAKPEGLPTVYETTTPIDKVLSLGYLLKDEQPQAKGRQKIISGLDENNPIHQKIIKRFFDNAIGFDSGYDPTKQAWCAAFVHHILTEMDADTLQTKDPYDRLRANKYKEYGQPVNIENIQEGDIVVFDWDKDGTADHVTFYAGGRITDQGKDQYINVVGGNHGLGGKVSLRENNSMYVLDNVVAIRRITYDGDAYEIAQTHKDSDPIFKSFLPEQLASNFAEGGTVMNEQMKMAFMQEGGLKDDGMRVDPVSGNEIPPGSMAKEVRDDIPAQLSEGEYVVPADVVQYFGVKYFEDLRMEAKRGLQGMEVDGRIGGQPVGNPQQTISDEELEMLIRQEMGQPNMNEGGLMGYQEGGTPAASVPTFDPSGFGTLGSTTFGSAASPTAGGATQVIVLYAPDGTAITLVLPRDKGTYDQLLAQGYTLEKPEEEKEEPKKDSGGPSTPEVESKPWYESINWENPVEQAKGMFKQKDSSGIGLMSVLSGVQDLSNVAKMRATVNLLESAGRKDEADEIRSLVEGFVDTSSTMFQTAANSLAPGTWNTNKGMTDLDTNLDGVLDANDKLIIPGLFKTATVTPTAPKPVVKPEPDAGTSSPNPVVGTAPTERQKGRNLSSTQSKNIKKEVSGMKTDSGKKVVTTDRKDALGKKAGEAGYKSALRKKQEDKKRREDAEKGQGAFAKQTAKTGAKGVNFGGRAKGGLMKKK